MSAVIRVFKRISLLFSRDRFRRDLDEEMEFHRTQTEKEYAARGMAADAARSAAMRQFGNPMRVREASHETVSFQAETVAQDIRFAIRQLRKNPGFAITAILILALGMGVSVAIFGFVDAALVEPLPYTNPSGLVSVDEASAMWPRSNLSYYDYLDWKRQNKSFSSLDVYTGMGWLLATPSGAVPVPAARVSDGFFSTLGVKPMLGRLFVPGEDQPGKPKIAVLSYGTWLKRYGARPDVVGQTVNLSGEAFTIVGVLPRDFAFQPRGNAEFWTPLLDLTGCEKRRSCHNLDGVARLRDGVSVQAALEEMKAIAAQLAKQYPGSNQGQTASVMPLSELIVGNIRPILFTVLAAAGLLLLIACVNVANLLLVRSESRRREIAVRGALGATSVRLVRQFVTEGLLLSAVGCLFGLVVAVWVMSLLTRLIPKAMADGIPFLKLVGLNTNTFVFAMAVAGIATLLLAATPALRLSFQDIRDGLSDGDRGSASRLWKRVGANLVVVELTIAVVLLAGGGLLAKSFYRLLHVENGFDTSHLATVQVMATDHGHEKDEQKLALYREINRRFGALPGVLSVGITSDLPVQCNCDTDWIRVAGKPFHGEHNEVNERDVSPDYLPTLKARLLRGRFLSPDDDARKSQKIVINESLARKYFPDEDPIGQKIGNGALDPKSIREIVGVIADVREGGLDQDVWPSEYQAIYYSPSSFFSVAVRTAGDEKALLPEIVSALRRIDPNLGVFGELSMMDQIETSESSLLHRFATWIVGGFAMIALVLSIVGLYGVIAYSVSQRTREIGVRMALGAQRSAVYSMVMRQAGWLTAIGITVGLMCAIGASLAMRKLLFGVAAWDVPTLAGVVGVLAIASLLASFVPARRAASVDPSEALRTE